VPAEKRYITNLFFNMKLFEDKMRNNYKPASSGEDAYTYYDNNEQEKIVDVRELLNKWFANYPDENKLELQHSFKNSFYNAFYELFIHETFYCQGYTLQVHPLLENSSKRPDFLAKKDKQEFYIEATTVSYITDEEGRRENFKQKFIDELNKMNCPNFWLALEKLEFKKGKFPKVKTLRKEIEQKLTKINPIDIETRQKNNLSNHELKCEDDNILIVLTLFNKSEIAKKNVNSRPIGLQFSPVTIKNADEDSDKILKAFKSKAGWYGELNKPFIICLNLDFNFNLKHDVDWAFYNRKSFNSLKPKFSKASAAFVSHVSVGNIFNLPKHRLILNRHSAYPLEIEKLELSYEDNEVESKRKDIHEILKLNNKPNFGITF